MVPFFDMTESLATVVRAIGPFCLLRTFHNQRCEEIRLMNGNTTISSMFLFAPSSPRNHRLLPTYTNVESLQSHRIRVTDLVTGSDNYFLVSCDYHERTNEGHSRLTSTAVFTPSGDTMGIILQDCTAGIGAEFKVTLCASAVDKLVKGLMTPAPPQPKNTRRKRVGGPPAPPTEKNKRRRKAGETPSSGPPPAGKTRTLHCLPLPSSPIPIAVTAATDPARHRLSPRAMASIVTTARAQTGGAAAVEYEDMLGRLSSLIKQKGGRQKGWACSENRGNQWDLMAHYLQILDLEEPITRMKVIHVTETNGKGSICTFTESIL